VGIRHRRQVQRGGWRLVESSAGLHDAREFLGHANITTTSRYVRSTPVRLAQALERMEASAAEPDDADERLQRAAVR
jgi:integrase